MRLASAEEEFPAVGALIKIGLPAIPALLEVIKKEPANDEDKLRAGLATYTLILIYRRAATPDIDGSKRNEQARTMTRLRIEQEMQVHPGPNLDAALEYPILEQR